MTELAELLAVARGDVPADLLLRGGQLVNVFTGEVQRVDITIHAGRVAGVGEGLSGREEIDLADSYVAPGLIDAHVHIESSMCTPREFAAALLPRGVTSVVADPHEIANVGGERDVRYMAKASAGLPLHVVLMGPSCVPASPLATAGAVVSPQDLSALLDEGLIHGLAEVMNFPGVVAGDPELLDKIARFAGRPIDGHCPGLMSQSLDAYAAAGIGSDHECITADEARAKLDRGLYLLIREASNARNLDALLPAVTPENARRVCFCTDDRTPSELRDAGSIDEMLRRTIASGIDPVTAIRMATLNAAECFALRDVGAVSPGRRANLIVFDKLDTPQPRLVFSNGQLVAEDGRLVIDLPTPDVDPPGSRCRVDWNVVTPRVAATSSKVRVIGTIPDQLVTENRIVDAPLRDGQLVADVKRDLLKILVAERHEVAGAFSTALIQGFGLKRGAIASTVAHDHHNLVVIGADDDAMIAAGQAINDMGGGLAVCDESGVVAKLPLPIAGLMSDRPFAEVAEGYDAVISAAHALGSPLQDPFIAMSFMALEVIPSLKITDLGLIDVDRFALTSLFVD